MEKIGSHWKDRLGIGASVLCAIHCAATPILLVFLPTLHFTEWMASPWFHQVAAIVCVSLVGVSIWPAYRKHKDVRVLGFAGTGLGMILSAAFLLPDYCCSGGACSSEHHDSEHHASGHLVSQLGNESNGAVAGGSHDHSNCDHDHGPFARFRASLASTPPNSSRTEVSEPSQGSSESEGIAGISVAASVASHDHGFLAAGLSDPIWQWLQPWLTPIGGCLLVVAHALNMRKGIGKHCGSHCKCDKKEEDVVSLSLSSAQAA